MLTINTNISSLIAQSSMKISTSSLNQAIERMSTGYKINHASDNAANYSIATNMTTKIGAYMVAEDNVLQGLDMVATASQNLNLIEDKLSRLRALAVQSSSGSYGEQSLKAINAEANALVDEINRTYSTSEYNGQKVFKNIAEPEIPDGIGTTGNVGVQPVATYSMRAADYGDFLADPCTYEQSYVDGLTAVSEVVEADGFTETEYKIANVDDLVALADLTNAGVDTTGVTFILAKDLDIGAYCDAEIANGNGGWTPIGNSTNNFKGTFDGNGNTISNLKITRNAAEQGLFGNAGENAIVQNLGVENVSIIGVKTNSAAIIGLANNAEVTNCYVSGEIKSSASAIGAVIGGCNYTVISACRVNANVTTTGNSVGCLSGNGSNNEMYSCIVNANVTGHGYVGGLAGTSHDAIVDNCTFSGNVKGSFMEVGGLIGRANGYATTTITNSQSSGRVETTGQGWGTSKVGGIIGVAGFSLRLENCSSSADISGPGDQVGGLVGLANNAGTISNCYATGDVVGNNYVAGIIGYARNVVTSNCYATGNITGNDYVGGLVGYLERWYHGSLASSSATGNVSGNAYVGGLVGRTDTEISNSYSTGSVLGNSFVGGLVGQVYKTSHSVSLTNCLSYSNVTGADIDSTGSLIGGAVVTTDNTNFGTINITGCTSMSQDMNTIGGSYMYASSTYTLLDTYDMSAMTAGVSLYVPEVTSLTLQVGANSPDSCQITFDMAFMLENVDDLRQIGLNTTPDSLALCDRLIAMVNDKQTLYGAVENRLMSVLDEITIQRDNLVSSRSTIRDADMSEVSSEYIRQQILQQASATLLATANQSPSIALQLI